jgi:Mg2+ and Co2+ transporter CorA
MNFKVPLFEHTWLFWVVIAFIATFAVVTVAIAKLRSWI